MNLVFRMTINDLQFFRKRYGYQCDKVRKKEEENYDEKNKDISHDLESFKLFMEIEMCLS